MNETVAKQKVLVVDDEPANIDILANVFEEDYQVNAAVSGEQALGIARSTDRPDIILLDVIMPHMDGYEVCRHLKQDEATCRIPVIFVTAKIQMKDEMRGLELGAVDYITKPISPPIVNARIKTHLSLCDQTRELDRKVRERTRELNDTRLQVVHLLGRAAEYKDEDAGLHVIRMGHYSYLLAIAAGMDEAGANLLLNAAPLHDIGKIGVPDSILQKTVKLDAHELKLMKMHCEIGAQIISENKSSSAGLLNLLH
jgi:putative two-component system response regulator